MILCGGKSQSVRSGKFISIHFKWSLTELIILASHVQVFWEVGKKKSKCCINKQLCVENVDDDFRQYWRRTCFIIHVKWFCASSIIKCQPSYWLTPWTLMYSHYTIMLEINLFDFSINPLLFFFIFHCTFPPSYLFIMPLPSPSLSRIPLFTYSLPSPPLFFLSYLPT